MLWKRQVPTIEKRGVVLPDVVGADLHGASFAGKPPLVVGGESSALALIAVWRKLIEGSFRTPVTTLLLDATVKDLRAIFPKSQWDRVIAMERSGEWDAIIEGAPVFAAIDGEILFLGPVTDSAWDRFEAFSPDY
ncbi:MAG TPA: hypothetical protein VGE01_14245 [Fimbriimonas sp.]